MKILHVHDNEGNRIGTTETDFLKEAKVMLALDDHPHVIKIAGICRGSKLMMVNYFFVSNYLQSKILDTLSRLLLLDIIISGD